MITIECPIYDYLLWVIVQFPFFIYVIDVGEIFVVGDGNQGLQVSLG